jgi:hypothetical protein
MSIDCMPQMTKEKPIGFSLVAHSSLLRGRKSRVLCHARARGQYTASVDRADSVRAIVGGTARASQVASPRFQTEYNRFMETMLAMLVRSANPQNVPWLRTKFLLHWFWQTIRIPSLWNNPVQLVTCWNTALLYGWPWQRQDPARITRMGCVCGFTGDPNSTDFYAHLQTCPLQIQSANAGKSLGENDHSEEREQKSKSKESN